MDTERRWAIVIVATEFVPTFEASLPPEHKLLAVCHLDDGTDQIIVSGPDMPEAEAGKPIPRTELLGTVDETGTYGYWTHAPDKRWRVG